MAGNIPDRHGDGLIAVPTPVCAMCGQVDVLYVALNAYMRWQSGTLIQVAFPDMSADVREQLITGTHPACWDAMFSDE